MYIIIEGLKFSPALQRDNTEKLKQIFLEKELRSLSPNFHFHMCLWAIDIFPGSVHHIFLQQNRQTDRGNIYKSLTDTLMWKLGLRLRNQNEPQRIYVWADPFFLDDDILLCCLHSYNESMECSMKDGWKRSHVNSSLCIISWWAYLQQSTGNITFLIPFLKWCR